MLTPEEEMQILKGALTQGYKGQVFKLIDQANLQKGQVAEEESQQEQGLKGSDGNTVMSFPETEGDFNTSIGSNANQITTTGDGNTIVGYNCDTSGATIGNELVIATNGMVGKGSQTAFINGGNGPTYSGNNATAFAQTSDRRIKKDIIPNNKGLESIKQIEPKYFYYKSDEEMQAELPDARENLPLDKQFTSAIAQELKEIFPEAVEERTKNNIMSVNTDPIFWSMVNAIKELSAKVDTLLTENTALKARVTTLEG